MKNFRKQALIYRTQQVPASAPASIMGVAVPSQPPPSPFPKPQGNRHQRRAQQTRQRRFFNQLKTKLGDDIDVKPDGKGGIHVHVAAPKESLETYVKRVNRGFPRTQIPSPNTVDQAELDGELVLLSRKETFSPNDGVEVEALPFVAEGVDTLLDKVRGELGEKDKEYCDGQVKKMQDSLQSTIQENVDRLNKK